jgi:anti-sigma factor RsiW
VSVLARDIACREAVELVTDFLEDALSSKDRRRFERHLERCDGCEAYLDEVRATIAAVGVVGPDDLSDATLAGLVTLYQKVRGAAP